MKTKLKSRKGAAASAILGLMIVLTIGTAVTFNIVWDVSNKAANTPTYANHTFLNGTDFTTTSNQSALTGFGDGSNFTILVADSTLYNSSDCSSGAFTLDTDWHILDNASTSPKLNWTETGFPKRDGQEGYCFNYVYKSSDYIDDSKTRTIINLLPLMTAVVLLTATASFLV